MTEAPSIKEALEQIITRVTIDPGDETVAPDIAHVLARGFHAMGWANPQAASVDMIEAVAAALATLSPPAVERREAGGDNMTEAPSIKEALEVSGDAIDEYYRYWTGGESRGSYDGRPERDNLWKAMYAVRAARKALYPAPLAQSVEKK